VGDLKAKARIGNIEIGYREALTTGSEEVMEIFDREVGGKSSKAACSVSVAPNTGSAENRPGAHSIELPDNNHLLVLTPTLDSEGSPLNDDHRGLPENLPLPSLLQALQNGASAALARGPTHNYPLHSTSIKITFDPATHLFPNSTPAALSSATRLATQRALKASAQQSAAVMMEPVMLVTISVDEGSMGSVVHDISSARGGTVVSLGSEDDYQNSTQSFIDVTKIYAPPDPFAGGHTVADATVNSGGGDGMRQIVARVPLKEMVGYLKHLRSLTGGRGTFTMVVDRFERMGRQRERAVVEGMRGGWS
jgi:elongation factor G